MSHSLHQEQHDANREDARLSPSSPALSYENDERAPVDFQVVGSDSEDDEIYNQLMVSPVFSGAEFLEKVACPLCGKQRQQLTCKECLLQGEFCIRNHSYKDISSTTERFCELKLKYLKARQKRKQLYDQADVYCQPKGKISAIVDEIERCKNTIATMKELKISLESRINNANRETKELKMQQERQRKLFPIFRQRLNNMKYKSEEDRKHAKQNVSEIKERHEKLKHETKAQIIDLMHHVFQLEEIEAPTRNLELRSESWNDEEDDTVRSLMAARSNYWSRPDELASTFGMCHSIAGGPMLPAMGDYSAYNVWTDRNPAGVSSGTIRNPAHCITAALTYTTLFVNLMAFYLDLRLPYRLSFSEFASGDLLGGKFHKKVAKLNANVIHLCSSQGVSPSLLQPRQTIPNILLLFNPDQADLGRRGAFEVSLQLAKSMEDSIEKDLVFFEEGLSESDLDCSDSTFPSDWATISCAALQEEFGVQEMTNHIYQPNLSPVLSYRSDSMYRSRNTASGTGLLSSVASLFRGWNK